MTNNDLRSNDLEFRLQKLIDDLTERREQVLNDYLNVLSEYDGGRASDHAGMLHDIDHHITNCHIEIKRHQGIRPKEQING